MTMADGRARVIIEAVSPQIDCGRFPIKRAIGEAVTVEADLFADGHDVLAATLFYRHSAASAWSELRMEPLVNDRWQGRFRVTELGLYLYTVEAWVDHFSSWRRNLEKKWQAGVDVSVELLGGIGFLEEAARRAPAQEAADLRAAAHNLATEGDLPISAKVATVLDARLAQLVGRYGARAFSTRFERELQVTVDPILARCSAWFEMFPRSAAAAPGQHGTFKDCAAWLPQIAQMGFDVLYLPPIHPIGRSFRKGRNNSLTPGADDPGSPWAIGASDGGHKAIHPELGSLADFHRLVQQARQLQIEVALDIAFQCSPDHPYVREHPDWFRQRADGSIQYAENPPKKYQDIYPLDFESPAWEGLWHELKSVFEFWVEQGVRVFRVDNPHTKPLRFWAWCLGELKRQHPHLIFLSEAFTRPKVMYHLAKAGFTQSYNYFPWRNTKQELTTYLTEVTQPPVSDYFRPNLWPNTPDILPQFLQFGGRAAFMTRFILAATLGASYGLYGPAFILGEHQPRETGSEEYLNSEKYELRRWNLEAEGNLVELITEVNRLRRRHAALQTNETLRFHPIDNEQLIAYSKTDTETDELILAIVNLDPHHTQRGMVTLPLEELGLPAQGTYQLHDLLTQARFLWTGTRNFVELDPRFVPAHLLQLRRYVRTEQDFDYFM
ncbi:MAG: maltotransferase domain-containing protein [Verrucomicrobiota bacterium]